MNGPPALANDTSSPSPGRATWLLALASITLLGAALRFYDCGHTLWLDELHTSWCASGSWADVSTRASLGNQPPLYFWLAWLITAGAGGSETLLRLPSLLAGTLLLPTLGWIGYRLTRKPAVGLIAAALVAINPWFIYYAQEARGYALVQLASLLHVFALVNVTTRATWPRRAAWLLLTVTLFYLHYTALLVLFGELLWYALARRWRSPHYPQQSYSIARITIDLTLAALLTLPGWSDVLDIYTRRQAWKAFVPSASVNAFFAIFDWLLLISPGLIAAGIAFGLAKKSPSSTTTPQRSNNKHDALPVPLLSQPTCGGLFVCWFLFPLALVWMVSYFDVAPLFYARFLGPLAVVPPLAAAWLARIPYQAWLRCLALAATLAVALTLYHPWIVFQHYGRFAARPAPAWPAAIDAIESDPRKPPQPVFYWSALIEGSDHAQAAQHARFREYLTYPFRGYYHFDATRPLEPILNQPHAWQPGPLSSAQLQQLHSAGGGWLIYAGDPPLSQQQANQVQRQLTPQDPSPPNYQAFKGITVYRIEMRQNSSSGQNDN